MAEKLDPNDTVTSEELAVSNMWEIAAIVGRLEHQGFWSTQERDDILERTCDAGIPRRGWARHARDDEQRCSS